MVAMPSLFWNVLNVTSNNSWSLGIHQNSCSDDKIHAIAACSPFTTPGVVSVFPLAVMECAESFSVPFLVTEKPVVEFARVLKCCNGLVLKSGYLSILAGAVFMFPTSTIW